MADPFSIIASAISVADVGIKLAKLLFNVVEGSRRAGKELQPIGDNVRLTSNVVRDIGDLMRKEEVRRICKKELVESTLGALGGCDRTFKDINHLLDKITQRDRSGNLTLKTLDRLAWTAREKEFDRQQLYLERFKSSLNVVLGMLTLVANVTCVLFVGDPSCESWLIKMRTDRLQTPR